MFDVYDRDHTYSSVSSRYYLINFSFYYHEVNGGKIVLEYYKVVYHFTSDRLMRFHRLKWYDEPNEEVR